MKKFASYLIYAILIACIACACSSDLDIKSDYQFQVTHLPVPKKLKLNEVAEIRCELERFGKYDNTKYYLRFFQSSGRGELKLNGVTLLPNDSYKLTAESFRLYYESQSQDTQTIDLYFQDCSGNQQALSFTFANDNGKEEES